MSTRANIEFIDEFGAKMFVDRSHDGFPDVVLEDIKNTVDACAGRWSGSEVGQLVSHFIGSNYNKTRRIQHYEPCHGQAGDESYVYYVLFNKDKGAYEFGAY